MIISCTSDKDIIALALTGAVSESNRLANDPRSERQVRRRALNNQIIPALIVELTRDAAQPGEFASGYELAPASDPGQNEQRQRWKVKTWYPGDIILDKIIPARSGEEAKDIIKQAGGMPITAELTEE